MRRWCCGFATLLLPLLVVIIWQTHEDVGQAHAFSALGRLWRRHREWDGLDASETAQCSIASEEVELIKERNQDGKKTLKGGWMGRARKVLRSEVIEVRYKGVASLRRGDCLDASIA